MIVLVTMISLLPLARPLFAKEECDRIYNACMDEAYKLPGSINDEESEFYKAWVECQTGEAKTCEWGTPAPEPEPAPSPEPEDVFPLTLEIDLFPDTPAVTIPVEITEPEPTTTPTPSPAPAPAPVAKPPVVTPPAPELEAVEQDAPPSPEELVATAEQEVIDAFENEQYDKIHARTVTVTREDGTTQKVLVMPRPGTRHGGFEYSMDGRTYTKNLRRLLNPSPLTRLWGGVKRLFSGKPTEQRAMDQIARNLLVKQFRSVQDNTGRTSIVNRSDFAAMLAAYATRRDLGDSSTKLFADGSEFIELVHVRNRSLNDLNLKLFEAGYQELLLLREFQQLQ